MQLVVTRRAFIALERPVGMVDRMFGHPFRNADLALAHAALKRDIALVAVGDDFFDTTAGPPRHLTPAVPTCKADASRGDGRKTDQRRP